MNNGSDVLQSVAVVTSDS